MSDQKQNVPSFAALRAAMDKNRQAVKAETPSIEAGLFAMPEMPEEASAYPEAEGTVEPVFTEDESPAASEPSGGPAAWETAAPASFGETGIAGWEPVVYAEAEEPEPEFAGEDLTAGWEPAAYAEEAGEPFTEEEAPVYAGDEEPAAYAEEAGEPFTEEEAPVYVGDEEPAAYAEKAGEPFTEEEAPAYAEPVRELLPPVEITVKPAASVMPAFLKNSPGRLKKTGTNAGPTTATAGSEEREPAPTAESAAVTDGTKPEVTASAAEGIRLAEEETASAAAGARTRVGSAARRKRRQEEKRDFLKLYTETVFNDQPVPEDMEEDNAGEPESFDDEEALKNGKKAKKLKKPGFLTRFGQPKTPQPAIDPSTVLRNDSLEGLTDEEVRIRTQAAMVNYTSKKGVRTTKQIILAHTITYFNILNLLLGFLVFLTGQYKNMLFMGVIICNSIIGIAQELKVKSLIDKLSVITASRVKVRRNGGETEIPTDQIVLDDVVYLSVGDQIVTDGRVYACRGLEVNESMLTGESKPVKKKDGDPVLSGSFIVAGTAVMKVEKVGADCYATQLVSKAQTKKRASSEMQTTIGRIIKVVSVAIIPIGFLLYRSQAAANGGDFAGTVVRTVSGVIGMIPEGLVLLTSVSFIIGVGRLAQKKALVQEMEAIEALARTNILCTDKTGTITTGELKVHKILPFGTATADQIRTILGHMNGAFDDTNATQEAMNRAFGTYDDWPVREIIPFSSSRKYRAASFGGRGDYAIGAPEFLMPGNKKLRALVEKYSEEGYRVLLLGRSSGISAAMDSHGNITPVALVIISDVIKEDAKEIFEYFAEAGVEVKVLSGDNPVTVSTVARRAGVRGAENYVDATTLPEKPSELVREISKYSVFGRVKPEQKQAFVKAWQMSGRTVAMVGDGVNDVLAIKDADCGIAMAAGSEAAKQAAHIVLMDSDFSSMKDIVKEGRTIISNIERVSSLYLTKTIYSSVLCLIFILLQTKYPFTTLQMGLINVCGIGMPSFLLTLEQQDNVHSEGFLKHILAVCLPAALTFVTSMMIVQILNALFRWPTDIYATFNLMLGGFVALLVVADVCWPLNNYRRFVLITCIVAFVLGLIIFPGFYDMHSLFMWWTLLLIPLCFLVAMLLFWYSRATNRFMVKVLKSREERKGIF